MLPFPVYSIPRVYTGLGYAYCLNGLCTHAGPIKVDRSEGAATWRSERDVRETHQRDTPQMHPGLKTWTMKAMVVKSAPWKTLGMGPSVWGIPAPAHPKRVKTTRRKRAEEDERYWTRVQSTADTFQFC